MENISNPGFNKDTEINYIYYTSDLIEQGFTFNTLSFIDTDNTSNNLKSPEKNENKLIENKKNKPNHCINQKRKRNNITEDKKQNMGRKKKDSISDSQHDKYSDDNVIYKMKTKFNNFIYSHLNSYLKEKRIKKIKQEYIKNGNKEYNIEFLESTIEDFLLKPISSKYKEQSSNENIIKNLKNRFPEVKQFLNQTYNEGLNNYLKGNYNNFYQNSCKNKFLYCNLNLDEKEREIWENLVNDNTDLYQYFLKKKGRKTLCIFN